MLLRASLALALAALPVTAVAQEAGQLAQAAPQAPAAHKQTLALKAQFDDKGAVIPAGVIWRVFAARNDETGNLPVVAESNDAEPQFALDPGTYVVNATYGLAATTRRVEVGAKPVTEMFLLKAGGLQISATINGKLLPAGQLSSRIMSVLPNGDRRLIGEGIAADAVLRLPEGQYFVECTYGDSNAVASAEVTILAGKLTDARFRQNAATLTLKLVSQTGGEAIANTSWSVLTPGGDVIRESIGAFPVMILAEGNYTVVARHDGRVYTREFDVKSGLDQDVELIAK